MFINQSRTIVENQCRDVNITIFLDIVYELQFFFLITALRKLDLDLLSGTKERNVLLSSALRQFYFKTETDSAFEKPIMNKSRRCPR